MEPSLQMRSKVLTFFYQEKELRDLFYRAATELIARDRSQAKITLDLRPGQAH